MRRLTVLHYVTQWLWLSDSFVYGPLVRSQHRALVVSRDRIVNRHVYPYPGVISLIGDDGWTLPEGQPTADAALAHLGGTRPDLVHLHHGYSIRDALAIATTLRIPLVVTFWGYDVTALVNDDPDYYRGLAVGIDCAIVPSRFLAARVRQLGVAEDRIRIVPGGVDVSYFVPTPMPVAPRVGFVGRFVPKKGVDVLLAAWRRVHQVLPEATLVLLGYGPQIPQDAADLGVSVVPPDSSDPRAQVRDLLRSVRVFVSPSRTGDNGDAESQHIGNLEALASGRPVVTTRHGGIPEFVVDGVNAVLVAEGEVGALAVALMSLLTDHDRCAQLAAAGRRWVERFDVTAGARALDATYLDVAS